MVCGLGKCKVAMWVHREESKHGTVQCAFCGESQNLTWKQSTRTVGLYKGIVDLYAAYQCIECKIMICTDCYIEMPEGKGRLEVMTKMM